MISRTKVVGLTLKINSNISREVAEQVFFRANPHQTAFAAQRLEEADITVENLQKYFENLVLAVAEFWNNTHDISFQATMKPHELRSLFLPLMYSVILSSVGNFKHGNFEYLIMATADEKPDVKFLMDFSVKLSNLRDIIIGDIGQVGNRAAQPQVATMLTVLSAVDEQTKSAEMLIRDGVTVDTQLAGLSTLVGLSLVEQAHAILYTGVEEVNFRQLTDTLVDKSLVAARKGATHE